MAKKINDKYNELLAIRDFLSSIYSELSLLEANDAVKRYISLKEYYEKYSFLESKSDEELLEVAMKGDTSLPNDIYFCFGHNLVGERDGNGYQISNERPEKMYIPVSKYRNLRDENDERIIPFIEDKEFEEQHQIIFAETSDPEQEYYELRKGLYLELFDNSKFRKI